HFPPLLFSFARQRRFSAPRPCNKFPSRNKDLPPSLQSPGERGTRGKPAHRLSNIFRTGTAFAGREVAQPPTCRPGTAHENTRPRIPRKGSLEGTRRRR